MHFGDAAHVHHIRLHNIHRPPADIVLELIPGTQVLTPGNRHRQRALHLQIALHISGVDRLLEPEDVECNQLTPDTHRGRGVVGLIGVHHQEDIRTNRLADGGHTAHVLCQGKSADLRLHARKAQLHVHAGLVQQPLRIRPAVGGCRDALFRIVEAGRVDGDALPHASAEERRDRQPACFSSDVPQRDVDRADGAAADPDGVVAIVERLEHPLPQPVALHRVRAQQQGRKPLVDQSRRRAAQPLPPADNAVVASQLHQPDIAPVLPALGPAKSRLDRRFKQKSFD